MNGMGKYLLSKERLINEIYDLRKTSPCYNKVVIIHPFYFNSVYRDKYFLFGKIFDSIINKKIIEINDTYFYRDMVHTKYMVQRSIDAVNDEVVGAGKLYYINDFIRDLYKIFNMDYDYYVKENLNYKEIEKKIYYSEQERIYTYDDLI
jgi:hypothetical protein